LTLTRLTRNDAAIAELRRASEIEPERARYTFVYAVALHSAGQTQKAITVLEENLARHPSDRDTLMALISFHRGAGHIDSALKYAEQLALIIPEDNDLAKLIQDLQRQSDKSGHQ
jgi:tetratricopeptide (TPR) repeat protein